MMTKSILIEHHPQFFTSMRDKIHEFKKCVTARAPTLSCANWEGPKIVVRWLSDFLDVTTHADGRRSLEF